jgi:hypothetical protein
LTFRKARSFHSSNKITIVLLFLKSLDRALLREEEGCQVIAPKRSTRQFPKVFP